jgi:TPR repeat protein
MTFHAQRSATLRRLALALGLALPQLQPCRASQPSYDPTSLQHAAASGDVTAEFQLGTLDYVGLGVVQDYIGAANLLKQAAIAGNAEAQCELGFLYQTGSFAQGPPPPDPKDALPWYEKSAAQGNPYGEFALAEMLNNGQGVAKDPAKAATLFAQARAQGVAPDPSTIPLQQLQRHFYGIAYKLTGQTHWVDLVSTAAGGGQ